MEELCKGDQGECPICLEAFEDAVLTPCTHRHAGNASWQVGEILILVYVLFVGIVKLSCKKFLYLLFNFDQRKFTIVFIAVVSSEYWL